MKRLAPIAFLCALACASPAGKGMWPSAESQGMLIARLTLRGNEALSKFPRRPTAMTFLKLGDDGKPQRDFPVVANFRAGYYLIALDISPGRYIPVSAAFPKAYLHHSVVFPESLGMQWLTEVPSGGVAFMGDATMNPGGGLDLKGMLAWSTTAPLEVGSPRIEKSVDDEAQALHEARRRLKNSGWRYPIDARLVAIGSPPVPMKKGLFFRKVVPPKKVGRWAYIDTLGWGKPQDIIGGLEWREPKKRALLQVSFMRQGMKGYSPQQEYLRYMRESGSPEDEHLIFTVPLAGKTARGVRYTTYVYPAAKLLGAEAKVYVTETLLVPDEDSYYLIRLRANRSDFRRFLPLFKEFLAYLVFLPKEKHA